MKIQYDVGSYVEKFYYQNNNKLLTREEVLEIFKNNNLISPKDYPSQYYLDGDAANAVIFINDNDTIDIGCCAKQYPLTYKNIHLIINAATVYKRLEK